MNIIYYTQFAGPRGAFANMLPGLQPGHVAREGPGPEGANPAAMSKLTPHQELLIATAWVDDHLDPSEAILLRQILQSCGLAAGEIETALQKPATPVDELLKDLPGGAPREALMRDVLRMCFTDGILEMEEFDLIERVAKQLQIDDETMNRLREQVSDE